MSKYLCACRSLLSGKGLSASEIRPSRFRRTHTNSNPYRATQREPAPGTTQKRGGRGEAAHQRRGCCVDNRWLLNQPVHDLQLTCSGVAVVYVLPKKGGVPSDPPSSTHDTLCGNHRATVRQEWLADSCRYDQRPTGCGTHKKGDPLRPPPMFDAYPKLGNKKHLSQSVQAPIKGVQGSIPATSRP